MENNLTALDHLEITEIRVALTKQIEQYREWASEDTSDRAYWLTCLARCESALEKIGY